ncbi:MAG: pirin family protein [Phycisphaerales bacterium]
MLTLRPAAERGRTRIGWLDSFHTFSFGEYHDPTHMSFSSLRVMNEDFVAPGMGFGMHPHRDMEIVTCVLQGELEHKDSLGNGEVLRPGEFQRMTAGTGILHSEFNPSKTNPVHLYQIWLFPWAKGLVPSYEQRPIPSSSPGTPTLVASPDAAAGSLLINQDARIYLLSVPAGAQSHLDLAAGRRAWVQVLRGESSINTIHGSTGDGVAVADESRLAFRSTAGAELMIFDLP